jgi:hypothetical protein
MNTLRTAHHALALVLAATVTLAMLGGVDRLAQPHGTPAPAAAGWAAAPVDAAGRT